MDVEAKLSAVKGFAEEIVTEDELRHLFETNDHPVAYDGFEPSGIAPIHFGLLRAKNLKRLLSTGVRFKLYLADYFAFVNNKLGGDLARIRRTGEYFVEVWKAAGVDMSRVEVVWARDLMDGIDYWDRVLRVGRAVNLSRIRRAITIMGRREGEELSTAQLFYPAMQVADIFQMDIDICQLGMDQRKANMLAREVADKYKWKKPVAVHHPLLLGLKGIDPSRIDKKLIGPMDFKMSKSDPKGSIFVHDSSAQIKEKINGAYCPAAAVEGNPLFDYIRRIIIDDVNEPVTIERQQKFGGDIEAGGYGELVRLYEAGKIHPMDIKNFVASELEKRIKPIREHFEKDKGASELYAEVSGYRVTR